MKDNNQLSATLILSQMAEKNILSENSRKIYLGYVTAFKEYLEAQRYKQQFIRHKYRCTGRLSTISTGKESCDNKNSRNKVKGL